MGKINGGRVVLGGLAAGLAYNLINWIGHGVILKAASSETMAELNIEPPGAGLQVQLWLIWLGYGVALAWIYAAIRPRFGPGFVTALRAVGIVWFIGIVVPALPMMVLGFATAGMVLADLLVGLTGLLAGGSIAGCLYREKEPAAEQTQ